MRGLPLLRSTAICTLRETSWLAYHVKDVAVLGTGEDSLIFRRQGRCVAILLPDEFAHLSRTPSFSLHPGTGMLQAIRKSWRMLLPVPLSWQVDLLGPHRAAGTKASGTLWPDGRAMFLQLLSFKHLSLLPDSLKLMGISCHIGSLGHDSIPQLGREQLTQRHPSNAMLLASALVAQNEPPESLLAQLSVDAGWICNGSVLPYPCCG